MEDEIGLLDDFRFLAGVLRSLYTMGVPLRSCHDIVSETLEREAIAILGARTLGGRSLSDYSAFLVWAV